MEMVFVGIGSNVDREQNIKVGINNLRASFGDITLSPVYESVAVGFKGKNFFNLVARFTTSLSPEQLVTELRRMEALCKRVRSNLSFGSRTLDLDLLMYGSLMQVDGKIRVPREEITKYAFVLKPLYDIASDVIHPVHGASIAKLWNDFHEPEQSLWLVRFNPS